MPQGRPGQVRKISPPTGIRSPDRPAHSQSLYLLIYPAHKQVYFGKTKLHGGTKSEKNFIIFVSIDLYLK